MPQHLHFLRLGTCLAILAFLPGLLVVGCADADNSNGSVSSGAPKQAAKSIHSLDVSLSDNDLYYMLKNSASAPWQASTPSSLFNLWIWIIDEAGAVHQQHFIYDTDHGFGLGNNKTVAANQAYKEKIDLTLWNERWKQRGTYYLKDGHSYVAFFEFDADLNRHRLCSPAFVVNAEGGKIVVSNYAASALPKVGVPNAGSTYRNLQKDPFAPGTIYYPLSVSLHGSTLGYVVKNPSLNKAALPWTRLGADGSYESPLLIFSFDENGAVYCLDFRESSMAQQIDVLRPIDGNGEISEQLDLTAWNKKWAKRDDFSFQDGHQYLVIFAMMLPEINPIPAFYLKHEKGEFSFLPIVPIN